jgi:tetrahydromethanopterin S-methyltransferase subunit B
MDSGDLITTAGPSILPPSFPGSTSLNHAAGTFTEVATGREGQLGMWKGMIMATLLAIIVG